MGEHHRFIMAAVGVPVAAEKAEEVVVMAAVF
jgi:hypothetical protein